MNLVRMPIPETPYGVPSRLELWESLHVPWRSCLLGGVEAPVGGKVEVRLRWRIGPREEEELLFLGEVVGRTAPLEFVCWGLPEWRREVGPQGFQDTDAATLLRWVAGQVGGKVRGLQAPTRRHYALPRLPAYQVVQRVLEPWGAGAIAHELDGGELYVGPASGSPHYGVLHLLKEEVAEARPLGGYTYLRCAPLPRLRLLHKVRWEGGEGRVVEHRLTLSPEQAQHEVYLEE